MYIHSRHTLTCQRHITAHHKIPPHEEGVRNYKMVINMKKGVRVTDLVPGLSAWCFTTAPLRLMIWCSNTGTRVFCLRIPSCYWVSHYVPLKT
jgi:hypothetical protein